MIYILISIIVVLLICILISYIVSHCSSIDNEYQMIKELSKYSNNTIDNNNNSFKLSIIIPVYNREKYLPQTLESVRKAVKNKRYEVIVIDDASKDSSNKIIEEYLSKIDNMRVITHKENKGIYETRIDGIRYAKGDYIAWIDADDYVDEYYLDELIFYSNNYDFIQARNFIRVNDKRKIKNKFISFKSISYFLWLGIYRTEILKEVIKSIHKDNSLKFTEDLLIHSLFLNRVHKYRLIYNRNYYYYNCNNENSLVKKGVSTKKKINDLKNTLEYLNKNVTNKQVKKDLVIDTIDNLNTYISIYV